MMLVIDTNTSCKGKGSWLKDQGVSAVGRYYGTTTTAKDLLDPDEAKELSKNGIQIFVVFEDHSRPDLTLTHDQGNSDAIAALKLAAKIRQPLGSAIYFAVEGDYDNGDVADIKQYMSGIATAIAGKYEIGVYGSGFVCNTLLTQGICKYTWVAAASTGWRGTCEFFGGKTPAWHLAQVPPLDMNWGGLSIDINLTNPPRYNSDFGGFVVPYSV